MGEEDRLKKVLYFKNLDRLDHALKFFGLENYSNKKTLVKLHMVEHKNKYFSKPEFVKLIIDSLIKVKAKPFLYDTTVLYNGKRKYVDGYKKLAELHGFTFENIGCGVEIDSDGTPIDVDGNKYIVGKELYKSDYLIGVSHFKGHIATGMGASIKNFGMGGVTKETKRKMHHGSKPIYQKDACTYCGICAEVCPFDALSVENDSWSIEKPSCFGCGVCVENCNSEALDYDDSNLQFVLACAAKACVQDKNVIYLNELKRIADSCDCDSYAKNIICPDIGYLVSDDIVAVDKASLDLINNIKKDVFGKTTHINPIKQIEFGEEIGLGSTNYQLIEI